jgi:hypothetical protein
MRRRQRLETAEKIAAAAITEHDARQKQRVEAERLQARDHATSVAALVLAGRPRIDEPLKEAWTRALLHYGISEQISDTRVAGPLLFPDIVGDEAEAAEKFTEIFGKAPIWLLQFTAVATDARCLKFRLPSLTVHLKWGSEGFEDARRWPLLPLGIMTAGDPIPTGYLKLGEPIADFDDRRVWIALWQTTDPIPDFRDNVDPDVKFVEDLAARPKNEWSRYETSRIRRLCRDPDLACMFALVCCLRDLPLPTFLPKSAIDDAGLLPATAQGRRRLGFAEPTDATTRTRDKGAVGRIKQSYRRARKN